MQLFLKVIRSGNSLVIPITKPLRELGLKEGDWVKVSLEIPDEPEYKRIIVGFDPSNIGERIIPLMKDYDWSDEQIRSIIVQYDRNNAHVELVLQYIREKMKKKPHEDTSASSYWH